MLSYRVSVRAGLLFILAGCLLAWGPIGHMTVAYVAYQRLTPTTKSRVRDLLKLNPDYANWDKQVPAGSSPEEHDRAIFMMAAVWADDIKGESQYSDDGLPDSGGNVPSNDPASSQNIGYSDMLRHRYWHFIDIPFSTDGTTLPPIPTPNAETQIDAFRTVLASSQPDELKSYDLVWLLHLVGDIHQPLHATARITQITPKGDAGGNTVKLQGDADSNLHSYWDDLPGSDCQYCRIKSNCVLRAIVLGKLIPPAAPKDARKIQTKFWVHESFEAARTVAYQAPIEAANGPYTIIPTSPYDVKAERLANKQIALASARLAQMLNSELK